MVALQALKNRMKAAFEVKCRMFVGSGKKGEGEATNTQVLKIFLRVLLVMQLAPSFL